MKSLPGDDIVPVTSAQETRTITIDAPPEAIWPWLYHGGAGILALGEVVPTPQPFGLPGRLEQFQGAVHRPAR